jgi:2-polyprenyl-6-methoxyphenol hydroxylase-like FAD-dependent oxidoreductase
LAASIFGLLEGKVETIFGDSVARIDQTDKNVRVAFEGGAERDFDLVVGADGLHSRVREIAFGAENRFEKYLGCKVAALEVSGYRPRDELTYVLYTEVGQQVGRFTMRGDRTLFLFTFADPDEAGPCDLSSQKALLRRRFGSSGWECPQILDALEAANNLYFDRVSQIRMDEHEGLWTRGRVTLVGDAASCVSLLAGQGTALAMVAAYILAGELHRSKGDYAEAFARYQSLFGPFVREKQKAALRFAGFFAPKSNFSLFLRNQVMKLLDVPWIADLTVGRDIADRIPLPQY